ncbi:MAG: NAD-dependent epimerase/dehydratase family protein [Candidatus Cloacimonadota bacterium]|nr:NAD-dependent epimerase/dehydratase family protein [Candidatus Cloacimonadota bacterium]
MKILLAGITGFIGGHLCRRLLENQHNKILSLIRPNTDIARYKEIKNKKVICKLGGLIDL